MSKATVGKFRFNPKIRGRLIAGLALVGMMLAGAVGTKVSSIETEAASIVGLRVPTAFASAGPVNDINASLAAPRGAMGLGLTNIRAYLLSGDDALAADLAENLRGEVDKFLKTLKAA